MAARGSAAKSAAGNAMSKYDVEVEARLKALEEKAHPMPTGATQKKVDDRLDALEARLAKLEAAPAPASAVSGDINVEALAKIIKMIEPNFDKLYSKFTS